MGKAGIYSVTAMRVEASPAIIDICQRGVVAAAVIDRDHRGAMLAL
jgi:hypothetical protein